MTNQDPIIRDDHFGLQSPLGAIVGFDVAEETYDLLTFREQLVIDLLVCGFSQSDIAKVFSVSQPSVSSSVRRIRVKLADSKLKMVLDLRQDFREGKTNNNVQR